MKTLTLTLAAAAIGLAGVSAPAFAENTIRKTQTVSYKGLDLNTVEGQKMLEQRVESAARRVCDFNGRPASIRLHSIARECRAKARASARAKVATAIENEQRGG